MNKFRGECEITIDGELTKMVFNMYCYSLLCEKLDCSLDELSDKLSGKTQFRSFSALIWCGIQTAHDYESSKNPYKFPDMPDVVTGISEGDLSKVSETIELSFASLSGDKEDSSKKK